MSRETGNRPSLLDRARYTARAVRLRALEQACRMGLRRAEAFVMEFPRSGGTWVKHMTRDLLVESGRSGDVIHNHWRESPHLRPAIYVARDGRDIVLSLYFYNVRFRGLGPAQAEHVDAYFARLLGPGADLQDVSANLPAFIASLPTHPFGGILRRRGNARFLPWPEHVREWFEADGVLTLRYEDLLTDAAAELRRVATHLGLEVGDTTIDAVVARRSFKAMTGREPGQEDPTGFRRKGIAGDWRNYFTRDAGEAFVAFAGAELVRLGYESSDAWVDGLPTRAGVRAPTPPSRPSP